MLNSSVYFKRLRLAYAVIVAVLLSVFVLVCVAARRGGDASIAALTAGRVPVASGPASLANGGMSDDGTTFGVPTKFGVEESTGYLALGSGHDSGTFNAGLLTIDSDGPAGQALRIYARDTNNGGTVPPFDNPITLIGHVGEIVTGAWVLISGTPFPQTEPTADPNMLGIVSDIIGPAQQVKNYTDPASYLYSGLDSSGNYTYSIGGDGRVQWGAGASHAAEDTNLYRSAAGSLKTDGSFTARLLAVLGADVDEYVDITNNHAGGGEFQVGVGATGSPRFPGFFIFDANASLVVSIAEGTDAFRAYFSAQFGRVISATDAPSATCDGGTAHPVPTGGEWKAHVTPGIDTTTCDLTFGHVLVSCTCSLKLDHTQIATGLGRTCSFTGAVLTVTAAPSWSLGDFDVDCSSSN